MTFCYRCLCLSCDCVIKALSRRSLKFISSYLPLFFFNHSLWLISARHYRLTFRRNRSPKIKSGRNWRHCASRSFPSFFFFFRWETRWTNAVSEHGGSAFPEKAVWMAVAGWMSDYYCQYNRGDSPRKLAKKLARATSTARSSALWQLENN